MTDRRVSSEDPSLTAQLVHRLCTCVIGTKDEAVVSTHYQFSLRALASNFSTTVESDEFQVAEKIKRKLVRKGKTKDAATFSELHRKLQSQGMLSNRWSILYLIMSLSGDKQDDKVLSNTALFGQMMPLYQMTSTPYGNALPPQTPALGNITTSTKSSGFSSLGADSTRTTNPTGQSILPGQYSSLVTPGVRSKGLGPKVAWTLSSKETPSIGIQETTTSTLPPRVKRSLDSDNTSMELPEPAILRDVMYILQGIDGKYIKMDLSKDSYRIDTEIGITKANRQLIKKLAECGWLYTKIQRYTDSRTAEKTFGLVGQSFCAALQRIQTEYYRLIAVLDAQLQQEMDQGIVGDAGGLSLRRLVLWMLDPSVRLKVTAALVDICKGKKGGALASSIHSYLQHGDPYERSLITHTLTLVIQPIFSTLTRWMYNGELDDAYHEFFVASDPSIKEERLWHDKYSLRKSMIPSFVTMDQARKILLSGKSINFLRQVCKDRTTIKGRDVVKKAEAKDADTMFNQDRDHAFQCMVDTVYTETSRHLLDVLHTKYKFMDHLKAMRRYLLLGQGDFIRHLMDLLEEDLAKPAGSLYLHNLTGILETAIRATNAQYDDSDILKRLDVRLLEISHGDTGWDVFSLDYHVDGPISTVFTPESMIMYLRVFNFLWRAKRMEYILAGIWKGQVSKFRMLRSLPELSPVLHQCHIITSEMIHFIQQVQYYINFEVLECSWDELLHKVHDAGDLDHIIAAHQIFQDSIINRSLLNEESRSILTQLRAIFDLIIQFQSIQDALYQSAEDENAIRLKYREQIKKQTEQLEDQPYEGGRHGSWGVMEVDEEEEQRRRQQFVQSAVYGSRAQLAVLATSYQDMVQNFLLMLQSHLDVSLRFLSFRLDFNEYYKGKEPKLRTSLYYRGKKTEMSSKSDIK